MTEFKDRLQQAIADMKITASELSRISGVGKSDISNYLKGVYVAKQDKCFLLAKALNVDPGWLMTGFEQKNDDDPEIHIVSGMMEGMTKEQKQQVIDLIKILVKKG